ncbi:3-deoxy-8-phosphooctulonate synthase [Pseudobacteriovorax antillogorgiicola]|uniref:3-deoxy-8-phosphooctulonate synthase n=1 Tax=Pseudobacteriovorax antillogorgiicola TaxID=1513793 RepID=A0A1Y6B839_9BACT|nr:3-deoxy-8-phosphooctulonate synthase [Pseudobacteriovorax antillogorgiicola]TCS59336.1 2-dehydro-3-deoxyphosphooctonate aldolase (KDO 8-P synthase) [Pseudobacteriovorax antillogorgiicola]SME89209.1 2-dehydro-3-deoxyphosphooctonate aldolase (KDO 8-P synthase) [Pseudobacteriovorax antillogorgiicola]
MSQLQFEQNGDKPVIIAGPCMAESKELVDEVANRMKELADELDFEYVFKASFDKANRTSITSDRGPGWHLARPWFEGIRDRLGVSALTDIHETPQVSAVAEVCDVLQIPAFLCRQTDLLVAAVETGRAVNVKKGQFLDPQSTNHITKKVRAVCESRHLKENLALTERGSSFGYGNLVVDMRGLKIMSDTGAATIFDVTHSLQLPSTGGKSGEVSGGLREFAPVLARAAVATGYLQGLFIEVHPEPAKAKSDAATQLSIEQASSLIRSLLPLWHQAKELKREDNRFS